MIVFCLGMYFTYPLGHAIRLVVGLILWYDALPYICVFPRFGDRYVAKEDNRRKEKEEKENTKRKLMTDRMNH